MAGCVVIRLLGLQDRNDFAADGLGLPAARMEVAAARWIDRTGYISFEDDALASSFYLRIGHRDG